MLLIFNANAKNTLMLLISNSYSLAHILHNTELDWDRVWKIVKDKRKSFLYEYSDVVCQNDDTILADEYIEENINATRRELRATLKSSKNVTKETLKIAAEMFTYLNHCPPKLISFYADLFNNGKPRYIMLALTSIIKSSQNAAKSSSLKIFSKVQEKFDLMNYEKVRIITNGKCLKDRIYGNCTKKVTVQDNDLKVLGLFYIYKILEFK